MQTIAADAIDFEAYRRHAQCKAKVKGPGEYHEALLAELSADMSSHAPRPFSHKLGRVLEFRPGEVTAWAGYSGHRKSMYTGQLALELGMQGSKTLVASFEMTPVKTLARMAAQFCGRERPSPDQIGAFMARTDRGVWLFDHQGRCGTEEMLAVCAYFADELKGSQVFIDSMMMVCNSEESLDEQKQFATDLVRLAQETGLHVHLIAHCRKPSSGDESNPPGKHDLRGTAAITDQCSNVVTVWANKPKQARLSDNPDDYAAQQEPDAVLNVCKQRNGRWEGKLKLHFHESSMRFMDERAERVPDWGVAA